MQPSEAEQVLQTRLAGWLPPQSTHITMARKACCCRFPRRWTVSQHSLQYLQRRSIFLSHYSVLLRVKKRVSTRVKAYFFCSPDSTKGTINNKCSSDRRSTQDLLYVSITQKLRFHPCDSGMCHLSNGLATGTFTL